MWDISKILSTFDAGALNKNQGHPCCAYYRILMSLSL
jgi:hypothetical protein